MSYNITTLDIKELSVNVPLSEFLMEFIGSAFREKYSLSEYCGMTWNEKGFVFSLDGENEVHGKLKDKDTINIFDLGVSSSYSSDLLEIVKSWCKKYKGTIKGVAVWEGGDSIEKISIKNGTVKKGK